MDCDQTRQAEAHLVLGAQRVAGAFRGGQRDINIGAWTDEVVVHVEAVAEHDMLASAQMRFDLVCIEHGLLFVRDKDHQHVGPLGGLGGRDHFKALGFCFGAAGRPLIEANLQLLHAAVAHVQNVGVALAAIPDHGDFLALDEGKVCILFVIDFHGPLLAPLED